MGLINTLTGDMQTSTDPLPEAEAPQTSAASSLSDLPLDSSLHPVPDISQICWCVCRLWRVAKKMVESVKVPAAAKLEGQSLIPRTTE